MKILVCTPTFATVTHGPALFARQVYGLNGKEGSVQVAILTEEPDGRPRVFPLSFRLPRPLHAFRKLFRAWAYWRAAQRLREQFAFDVLLFNDAVLGFFASRFTSREFRVAVRLNDAAYLHPNQPGGTPLRKQLIRRFYRFFERLTLQQADEVLPCSNFLAAAAQKQHGHLPHLAVLRDGIDTSGISFVAPEQRPPAKQRHILFVKADFRVGRLVDLIQALGALSDHSFQLSVVGPALTYADVFRKWAAPYPHLSIDLKGPLSQSAVYQLLQSAEILCIPSAQEGLGVANIEGLAAGISIVSTRVGGIPEVLDEGRLGWLAEAENVSDLARAIESCLATPLAKRAELARQGRQWVENQFSCQQMQQRLLDALLADAAHA